MGLIDGVGLVGGTFLLIDLLPVGRVCRAAPLGVVSVTDRDMTVGLFTNIRTVNLVYTLLTARSSRYVQEHACELLVLSFQDTPKIQNLIV